MYVLLSWLKEFIPLTASPEEIGDILTLAGLEVDGIEQVGPDISNVVVGEVRHVRPHPEADKLQIATVFDGECETEVVCGAPNCREGIKTAYARIGAKLGTHKIKKAKLRGIESAGMLCSEEELGVSPDHDGIMELELAPGTDLAAHYADTRFEISLTPNLGHCTSILGIARELAAHMGLPLTLPPVTYSPSGSTALKVDIADDRCFQYHCQVVHNIHVGPSPDWLVKRLEHCGFRSVNNIVDVTNYVMMELGQPMHAFDLEKLSGHITIKALDKPTDIAVLDETTRKLPPGNLCICDAKGPIAIAGVIGGADSAISETSQSILLEAAQFCPSAVRAAAKAIHVRTESSGRFEKGVDPEGVRRALSRAVNLLEEIAEGKPSQEVVSAIAKPYAPRTLTYRPERINALLGTELSEPEIEECLGRLDMKASGGQVTPPSYRNDLHEEIDLVEEVARVYGYHNIPKKAPRYQGSTLPHSPLYLLERKLRSIAIAQGLQEFVTCDLISPRQAELCLEETMGQTDLIPVLMPSSVDQSILRPTMLPGLLQSLQHNANQKAFDISAFELGRIHFKSQERMTLALIMTGKRTPHHWDEKDKQVDFFDLKGHVESILEVYAPTYSKSGFSTFHPGKQASIHCGNVVVGALGEVHPKIVKAMGIESAVYFAQVDVEELLKLQKGFHIMDPLPAYPGSERDLTLTLAKTADSGEVVNVVSGKSKLLKNVQLIDVYESEKLRPDRRNLTYRFTYRDDTKTVKYETVEKEHGRLLEMVAKKFPS